VAVLFINVPFDRVDVNVHPAKNEVRFADQNKVHDAVARAVLHGVKSADYRSRNTDQIHEDQRPCIAESVKTYEPSPEPDKPVYPHKISGINPNNFNKTDWPQKSDTSQLKPDQVKLWRKGRFSDLKVMGQFHNTYIICESQNEIIFIDQHAAHERILYEQLKNHSETLRLGSQQLLVPETIELNYTEAVIIQKLIPGFNEYGLEIEPFGGNTFVVKTVPAVFSGKDIKSMIMELIDKMAETGISQQPGKPADQCLMVMACHGAIRANQRLSDKQMKNLLARLDLCDNPSNCPHGRPTWISYDMQHMEKAFRRIA
jgi:DNA mismatch repair protein MutL